MPSGNIATQEGVVLIERESEMRWMVVKIKGEIKYYKLKEASWQDHIEMHNASVAK